MARITLKYATHCTDCGAYLPEGSPARYYGRNGTFGVHCHAPPRHPDEEREQIKQYKRAKAELAEREAS